MLYQAVFQRYLRPEKDYLSFSLIYNNGKRSLDLVSNATFDILFVYKWSTIVDIFILLLASVFNLMSCWLLDLQGQSWGRGVDCRPQSINILWTGWTLQNWWLEWWRPLPWCNSISKIQAFQFFVNCFTVIANSYKLCLT